MVCGTITYDACTTPGPAWRVMVLTPVSIDGDGILYKLHRFFSCRLTRSLVKWTIARASIKHHRDRGTRRLFGTTESYSTNADTLFDCLFLPHYLSFNLDLFFLLPCSRSCSQPGPRIHASARARWDDRRPSCASDKPSPSQASVAGTR